MNRAVRLTWSALGLSVVVILLGALVRATGSGAGCGRSWPTCHGALIPPELAGARAIEFTHRAASGVALLAVALVVIVVFRSYPGGHPARAGAGWSAIAILGEAAIGAGLVLFEWVGEDQSVARAVAVPLHLVNTLLLLAALTLTAFWVLGGGRMRFARDRALARKLLAAAAGMLVVGATGAVTALADTLFPAESLAEGLAADLAGAEHFLTRLRALHPVVAIVVGVFIAFLARWHGLGAPERRRVSMLIIGLVAAQLVAGVLNVVLLTPLWLQLLHLFLADALWVALVWFGAVSLAERTPRPARSPVG